MPSAAFLLMRAFLMVPPCSVKIGNWLSEPPEQVVPSVAPPQSTVPVMTLPALQVLGSTGPPDEVLLEEELELLLEDELLLEELLDDEELDEEELDVELLDVEEELVDEELELDEELVVPPAGIEHSLTPPAMRPPKVVALHTKEPDSTL